MNINQINEIIRNYNNLVELAESKIEIMKNVDSQYDTMRGIEKIYFDINVGEVSVRCDDSCCGSYDCHYFSFPINFLSKADAELEEFIIAEKELNEIAERKMKEEKLLKEKEEAEQRELEHYLKLKEKFELQ